jgi:hypothetical protein
MRVNKDIPAVALSGTVLIFFGSVHSIKRFFKGMSGSYYLEVSVNWYLGTYGNFHETIHERCKTDLTILKSQL